MIAQLGLASRREAEEWIRTGRLTVNGKPVALGVRVRPRDQLRLDGRLIKQRPVGGKVFLCHRSPGENLRPPAQIPQASADAAMAHEVAAAPGPALLERLPRRAGRRFIPISPMPRVDGGLELVTSDGELAAQLQRSVGQLVSEFSVRIRGELTEQQLQNVLVGTLDQGQLEIGRCEAAGGEGANRWYVVTATGASGKQIRQLFERQGALVSRVLRTKLGPLALDRTLSRGHFREVSAQELEALIPPVTDSRSSRP